MTQATYPVLALSLTSSAGVQPTQEPSQGDVGRTQLLVITDQPDISPETLGFRASLPGGDFVDVREGFSRADGGTLLFKIPDQTFSKAGTVVCYFYVFDGDALLASTGAFTYHVRPQFAKGLGGSSYSKTLETLQSDMESTLTDLKDEVTKWMASADVEGEVKRQLQSTLTSIGSWEQSQTAAMAKVLADKEAALDKAQADYVTEHNALVADIASLTKVQTNAETATKQATDAASEASAAQKTATDAASKATTSAGNADKATASATQATADAQTQIKALTDKLASVDADWDKQQKTIQDAADAQIKSISDSLAEWQAKIDSVGSDIKTLQATIAEIQASVPVKTVGGQKPDENGNIDMDAYAVLGGDNNWSGKNDFGVTPTIAGQTIPELVGGGGRNLLSGLPSEITVPIAKGCRSFPIGTGVLESNQVYTISGKVRPDSNGVYPPAAKAGLGFTKSSVDQPSQVAVADGKFKMTVSTQHESSYIFLYCGDANWNGSGWISHVDTITVYDLMLENGSVAHDWSPAPEDYQNQIDTLNNAIKSLQTQISGGGSNLLKDTSFAQQQWVADFGSPTVEFTSDGLKITHIDSAGQTNQAGALSTSGIPELTDGQTYTISVEARGNGVVQFYMMGSPANTILSGDKPITGPENWTTVTTSFVYWAPANGAKGFELFAKGSEPIEFKKNTLILTQGTEVVPWEPAPGETVWTKDYADLAARITALEGGTTV